MSLTVPCLIQLMGSARRFLRLSFESEDFSLFPVGKWTSTL